MKVYLIFILKDEVVQANRMIDQQVELLEEEISIRIETLKANLNNLKNDLLVELEGKKEEMKK